METTNQPTFMPTRKVWAALISGLVAIIAQVLLQKYAPGVPIADLLAQLDYVVQALVMAAAMYWTKEWSR